MLRRVHIENIVFCYLIPNRQRLGAGQPESRRKIYRKLAGENRCNQRKPSGLPVTACSLLKTMRKPSARTGRSATRRSLPSFLMPESPVWGYKPCQCLYTVWGARIYVLQSSDKSPRMRVLIYYGDFPISNQYRYQRAFVLTPSQLELLWTRTKEQCRKIH